MSLYRLIECKVGWGIRRFDCVSAITMSFNVVGAREAPFGNERGYCQCEWVVLMLSFYMRY